nr:uncharacterized protein LOC109167856 [Ipomoea batatas]
MSNPRHQDPGWEHGTPVLDKGTTHVRCNYCQKITKGGIYRHKLHLVGGSRHATACTKCPKVVRDAMREIMQTKKQRKDEVSSTGASPFNENYDDVDMDFPEENANQAMGASMGSSNKSIKGPMDLYFNSKEHQKLKRTKGSETVTLEACKKELRERAMVQFSRWMYEAGLPYNNSNKYKKVFEIIDRRWSSQLRQPLHAAAYYLNPDFFRYRSEPPVSPSINSAEVVAGFYECLERLVPDQDLHEKIIEEVTSWEVGTGLFGMAVAKKQRGSKAPGVPEDANDELVFEDGDGLTWGEIAKFSGANETPYSLRHASKGKEKVGSSSRSKGKEKILHLRLEHIFFGRSIGCQKGADEYYKLIGTFSDGKLKGKRMKKNVKNVVKFLHHSLAFFEILHLRLSSFSWSAQHLPKMSPLEINQSALRSRENKLPALPLGTHRNFFKRKALRLIVAVRLSDSNDQQNFDPRQSHTHQASTFDNGRATGTR